MNIILIPCAIHTHIDTQAPMRVKSVAKAGRDRRCLWSADKAGAGREAVYLCTFQKRGAIACPNMIAPHSLAFSLLPSPPFLVSPFPSRILSLFLCLSLRLSLENGLLCKTGRIGSRKVVGGRRELQLTSSRIHRPHHVARMLVPPSLGLLSSLENPLRVRDPPLYSMM